MSFTIMKTENTAHIHSIMKGIGLPSFDTVIVVGGDGRVHHALNGVMSRPDWYSIISRIHFGIIPAGRNNGFAKSILSEAEEAYCPEAAAFLIGRGRKR